MTGMYRPVSNQVKNMFASIAARYDVANSVLSLGMHHLWKRSFIKNIPYENPSRVMDLATGTGDLVPILAKRFKSETEELEVIGVDFCEPMLERAKERFTNYEFVVGDAMNLGFVDNQFDVVTVSFGVRNFENLEHGLTEIFRVLKPKGVIAILEFGQPRGLFGILYRFYSKFIMPIIGGLLTGNKIAYTYLPQTAAEFPCGDQFVTLMNSIGFQNVICRPYTFGIAYSYYGHKK